MSKPSPSELASLASLKGVAWAWQRLSDDGSDNQQWWLLGIGLMKAAVRWRKTTDTASHRCAIFYVFEGGGVVSLPGYRYTGS